MAVFASQTSDLSVVGPLIEVVLVPNTAVEQSLKAAGKPVPDPITVTALIDTGAGMTVVKTGFAQRLGLLPVDTQLIHTPSSQNVQCFRYLFGMAFQPMAGGQSQTYFEPIVTEAPMPGQNIQCLLGRDFLSMGVLVYTGPTNSFTFSF